MADLPRSLRNAWSNRPGRRVADGLCSRPPLWGSDRRLPHWAAGLLGREDGRVRGCPSVAALAGPSSAAGVAAPVAGCVGRGSGLCCGLADPGRARARAPRLVAAPGCRPGRQLTLLSCAYAGRTEQLGSRPLPGGGVEKWRKQAVKGKSDVVINHRRRGHQSLSDFGSWGQRSQLPFRGRAGAADFLRGRGARRL